MRRAATTLTAAMIVASGCGGFEISSVDDRSAGENTTTTVDLDDLNVLERAREVCAPTTRHVRLGDEGATLTVDTEGEDPLDSPGASFVDLFCVIDELDVPDVIVARMENTRALDGAQTAEWGDLSAFWSYHPDSGFELIVSDLTESTAG
ncbi:MAG: hypothetical protein S0880_23770 [Actinomycetota bacterium]|nr:hypothetical protein [Actinomycetota bacterium]